MAHTGTNIERSDDYGALQAVVDALFDGLEEEAPAVPAPASTLEPAPTDGQASPSRDAEAAAARGVSEHTASVLGLGALLGALEPNPDASPSPNPGAAAPAGPTVRRLDAVLAAEAADLPEDLLRVVWLLPPGDYTRERLCTQLNSAITGHAWGQVYGTVS